MQILKLKQGPRVKELKKMLKYIWEIYTSLPLTFPPPNFFFSEQSYSRKPKLAIQQPFPLDYGEGRQLPAWDHELIQKPEFTSAEWKHPVKWAGTGLTVYGLRGTARA